MQAWNLWKQGDIQELKDASLDSGPKEEVLKFIHIGLLCVQEYAVDRVTMSEVISMLTSSDITSFPDPKQPAYTISRSEVGSPLPDKSSSMASTNYESITVIQAR